MDTKYQIFVSSTYEDLKEERLRVMERIINMGHIPVGMELFNAANQAQWNYITRRIEECDYYIVIVAERYGSRDAHGKSYTQKEFEFANQCGVPALAFLLHKDARARWPQDRVEFDRRREVDEFRELCSGKRMVAFWKDASDLEGKVTLSLLELVKAHPRSGLVRAEPWLAGRLGLEPGDEQSMKTATKLLDAIKSDLAAVGFYRREQTISISMEQRRSDTYITLDFKSTLIPIGKEATVSWPKVEAPANAELDGDPTYQVGDLVLGRGDFHSITESSAEHLSVRYRIKQSGPIDISDTHFWTSSILEYAIHFQKFDGMSLKVWRLNAREKGERLNGKSQTPAGAIEFRGKGAAFTAQGLRWQISAS